MASLSELAADSNILRAAVVERDDVYNRQVKATRDLEQQVAGMKPIVEAHSQLKSELANLHKQTASLNSRIQSLTKSEEALKSELRNCQESRHEALKLNSTLAREAEEFKSKSRSLEAQVKELSIENNALIQASAAPLSARATSDEELMFLKQTITEERQQNEHLQIKLTTLNEEVESLRDQIKVLNDTSNEKDLSLHKHIIINNNLQKDLESSQSTNAQLESRFNILQAKYTDFVTQQQKKITGPLTSDHSVKQQQLLEQHMGASLNKNLPDLSNVSFSYNQGRNLFSEADTAANRNSSSTTTASGTQHQQNDLAKKTSSSTSAASSNSAPCGPSASSAGESRQLTKESSALTASSSVSSAACVQALPTSSVSKSSTSLTPTNNHSQQMNQDEAPIFMNNIRSSETPRSSSHQAAMSLSQRNNRSNLTDTQSALSSSKTPRSSTATTNKQPQPTSEALPSSTAKASTKQPPLHGKPTSANTNHPRNNVQQRSEQSNTPTNNHLKQQSAHHQPCLDASLRHSAFSAAQQDALPVQHTSSNSQIVSAADSSLEWAPYLPNPSNCPVEIAISETLEAHGLLIHPPHPWILRLSSADPNLPVLPEGTLPYLVCDKYVGVGVCAASGAPLVAIEDGQIVALVDFALGGADVNAAAAAGEATTMERNSYEQQHQQQYLPPLEPGYVYYQLEDGSIVAGPAEEKIHQPQAQQASSYYYYAE
eukprot:GDKK01009352.1.p1 GENE.GDKK01009352.1~~GDKK01009352.1.p1  ORF type:complete len:753 (-),score=204.78 GDKK01009352.1:104-2248(-)